MTRSLLVFSLRVATPLNGFRKHSKCMTSIHKFVCDAYFFRLNVNDFYNYNMNSVDLSDQIWNLYRVDHCIRKYNWWCYLFFWVRVLFLVNCYIIYKTLCEEGEVKTVIHYEFRRLISWQILTPQILAAAIIWFQRFNNKA